ncbi:hypothetical protein Solca_3411 [Solitalea canadensis DSM 3403]|uniref:Uncharacterized protein n=1 Tax=Solitalea canadensis (strain ATCC 29591 / DSM 3403 / JCM 21819 / LMG 8368 / NBRC 15130 / NCIMB 12057 / USAM 9D) TaxID=929556 RepID=H8KX89_SOLCM|nr:hypothetical protein Solca_3411 [Solitalea canadensis DSM 3403]
MDRFGSLPGRFFVYVYTVLINLRKAIVAEN